MFKITITEIDDKLNQSARKIISLLGNGKDSKDDDLLELLMLIDDMQHLIMIGTYDC